MSKQLKAAGYIRVSSEEQTKNESLPEQRALIKKYCDEHGYKLTKIYEDAGISGKTTKDRLGIQQAINDANAGKFDALIVKKLDRFGRDLLEILLNKRALEDTGIKLFATNEDIQDTLSLQIKGALAEQEIKDINERMMGGRIAKAKRGVPTNGTLPFGRTYDKESGEWGTDQNKVDAIEWVYQEYVKKDRSLQQIALEIEHFFEFSIHYQNLVEILKEKCGTDWEINFKEHDKPIPFKIPRLLSDQKIKDIKDRLAHNRTNNRTDVKNKYLLTGFIRCMHCKKSLSGQRQKKPGKKTHEYYVHPSNKRETCEEFSTVSLPKLENAVFQTIFENMYDAPSFEKAIKESLPDEKHIEKLEKEIDTKKERRKKINDEWDNLKKVARSGIYNEDEIRKDVEELREIREQLTDEITDDENRLATLPDPEEVRKEAHRIRRQLKRKFQSKEHLQNMSFEDKKMLLHFLFDGKAPNGDHYGIYVDKRGKGKNAEIDYMMFGRITGLRTIKGDNIDYDPNDDGENGGNSSTTKNKSTHKNSHYKTNNFSLIQNEPKDQGCGELAGVRPVQGDRVAKVHMLSGHLTGTEPERNAHVAFPAHSLSLRRSLRGRACLPP